MEKKTTPLEGIIRAQEASDIARRSFSKGALAALKMDNPAFSALREMRSNMEMFSKLSDPIRNIGVAAELSRIQQAGVFASLHKDAAAFQNRFELPTLKMMESLRENLGVISELQIISNRYALESRSITNAMKAMHTPWINKLDQSRSLSAFAALQGIGRTLSTSNGFDLKVSKLIRSDLGDWRDKITWKSAEINDYQKRRSLYQKQGFNINLTEMPDEAFDEAIAEAELDGSAPTLIAVFGDPLNLMDIDQNGLERTNFAHRWLFSLETQIRQFIDLHMQAAFGVDWPRKQLPNDMFGKWVKRKQTRERTNEIELSVIAYSDFSDYERVITKRDNWKQVFKPVFHRQENVRETFQRLYPIRLDTMHARMITKDDILLLYTETTRLVRLFSTFGRIR